MKRGLKKLQKKEKTNTILVSFSLLLNISLLRGQGSFMGSLQDVREKSELTFPWEKLELSVGDLCYHSWSQCRWNTPLHTGSCEGFNSFLCQR